MFCTKCGSYSSQDTRFCGNCGADLATPTPASIPTPTPTPQPPANAQSHCGAIDTLLASPLTCILAFIVTFLSVKSISDALPNVLRWFESDTHQYLKSADSILVFAEILCLIGSLLLIATAVVLTVGMWFMYYGGYAHSRKAVEGAKLTEKGFIFACAYITLDILISIIYLSYNAREYPYYLSADTKLYYICLFISSGLLLTMIISFMRFFTGVRRTLTATTPVFEVRGQATAVLSFVIAGLMIVGTAFISNSPISDYYYMNDSRFYNDITALILFGVFALSYQSKLKPFTPHSSVSSR